MRKQTGFSLKKLNNAGTTMVEVVAGFVILTVVLAACVVHMINVSGNMVMKSKDILTEQETLTQEMYKKGAQFVTVCGEEASESISLRIDTTKTDVYLNRLVDSRQENYENLSIPLNDAKLQRFDCEKAELSVFRLSYAGEAGGTP